MATGVNATIYFRSPDTLERLQQVADVANTSVSAIIDSTMAAMLESIERDLPTKRAFDVQKVTVKV